MRPPKETSSEPDSGRVGARAEGRVLCYKGITGIVENLSLRTQNTQEFFVWSSQIFSMFKIVSKLKSLTTRHSKHGESGNGPVCPVLGTETGNGPETACDAPSCTAPTAAPAFGVVTSGRQDPESKAAPCTPCSLAGLGLLHRQDATTPTDTLSR